MHHMGQQRILAHSRDVPGGMDRTKSYQRFVRSVTTSLSILLTTFTYPLKKTRNHRKVGHRGPEDVPTGPRPRHEELHPRAPNRVHPRRARSSLGRHCRSRRSRPAHAVFHGGGAAAAPQSEEAVRQAREKAREQERNQRSIQWAYDTFEGALSVGRQSVSVAIEFVRDAWDQSSTSTILYFVISRPGLNSTCIVIL